MNSETFIDKSCGSIQKNNPTKTASICLPNPIQYASQVSKKTYYMIYKPISSRLFLKNGIEAFTALLFKNCPFCNTYPPPLHFLIKLSHLLIPAPLCDKLPAPRFNSSSTILLYHNSALFYNSVSPILQQLLHFVIKLLQCVIKITPLLNK